MSNNVYVTNSTMPSYDEYIEAIKPLWDTRILTNMGTYHTELENKLVEYLQVPYVSLMVNGHMALELAIQSFGFPEGSEIITSPFTFISTTHSIIRNHLVPVFCDIKECDGTIDETKIENLITEKTVAIMPIHVYGHVCNVNEIKKIADRHNLKVIYDAAHAFGVSYQGKGIGSFGDASCFSFHATKVFNTIEGGAVTFSESDIYDTLRNLKNFGIRGEELVVEVGANAKMNEFSAIMGLCNLRHIEAALDNRRMRYDYYRSLLKDIGQISYFTYNSDEKWNYSYFPILINEGEKVNRDAVYDYLKENGIYARKYFYPLTSDQHCFGEQYLLDDLNVARTLAAKILVLPLYENLTFESIDRISLLLHEFCK